MAKRSGSTSAAFTAGEEAAAGDKAGPRKDYLRTTELARLCGVSRFTILNWINRGRIQAVRTVGGHYRIPASAAASFLRVVHSEAFRKHKRAAASGALGHCWQYPQETNCSNECGDCLIYGRASVFCFVAVRQFDKDAIGCKGDCLTCGYFEEFFGLKPKRSRPEESPDGESEEAATEKKDVLRQLAGGVGRVVGGAVDAVASTGRAVKGAVRQS